MADKDTIMTNAVMGKGKEKEVDEKDEKGMDYYFQYYASLQNQANMIGDIHRTSAYRKAILGNSLGAFKDKTVIDIGAGSGILSFFAAQAGATSVISIEASTISQKLSLLVSLASRSLNPHIAGKIRVIHGKVEDEKVQAEVMERGRVDTIISEPIGVMLFHERMVESFLLARDLFLKPGGSLHPSQGGLYFAPFSDEALFLETEAKGAFFNQTLFGTDFSPLAALAREEVFAQPVVGLIPPTTLLNEGICSRMFDFYTLTLPDLKDFTLPLDFIVPRTTVIHGIASWFDLSFHAPPSTPPNTSHINEALRTQWHASSSSTAAWPWAGYENGLNPPELPKPCVDGLSVRLDTGPFSPRTHWQQARLLLPDPLAINRGERLLGSIHFVANESRSYDLTLSLRIDRGKGEEVLLGRTAKYSLSQQTFNYSYTGEEGKMAMGGLGVGAGGMMNGFGGL